MVLATTLNNLGVVCKRYGPGRLPRAERRDIGAGYAGASAAFAIAVVYALATAATYRLGVASDFVHPFWSASALVAVPFVVPAAFVVGTAVWRYLPDRIPCFGAVAGLLATALTYALSLAFVFVAVLAVVLVTESGTGIETTAELLTVTGATTVTVGVFALVLTAWLTVPVGCLSGAIYERARTVPVR